MRESQAIQRLRRIATSPAALGLADDTALLDGLVLTHDSIAEGIHFLPSDPAASVGWKLVTVNLSDLAAKGATPAAALLSLALSGDDVWDMSFLDGIEAACESYGLALVGGDTIALPAGRSAGVRADGDRPRRRGGSAAHGREGRRCLVARRHAGRFRGRPRLARSGCSRDWRARRRVSSSSAAAGRGPGARATCACDDGRL